jgi:PLP dependent protein
MRSALTADDLKTRFETIQARIEDAAKKCGRSLKDITLVAVTKGTKAELIRQAREAGIAICGENRVQEAEEKILALPGVEIQWHLVGHLQSNKVKTAISLFQLIHSVDTVRLAGKISQESLVENRICSVLLEVNISGEAQKYGFKPEEVYSAIDEIGQMPGIRVQGLMGIAPNTTEEQPKRDAFKKLKGIFSACKMLKHPNIEMKYLSMGMSDDYVIAVEEGSNMVRIGRALFK